MNSRYAVLSDFQWELISPLMPDSAGKAGRPFKGHRLVTEGIIYRYRAGIPWLDLPGHFGSTKIVWKRHTAATQATAPGTRSWRPCRAAPTPKGLIDWEVSVDSTINRAHQYGTNLPTTRGRIFRITRICSKSLLTMPSASPAAG